MKTYLEKKMTTRLSKSRAGRSGFTLVELLVAITVIAILVGMLSAAVIPVLSRAREIAIVTQMKQVELAIEEFNNDHGFYPPSWATMTGPDRLLRFLDRIAPNHREREVLTGTTRRVDAWWAEVGTSIVPATGDDLVFWLSGLSKNAQYPLTNRMTAGFAEYNDGSFERKVYFEFPANQLEIDGAVARFHQQAGVDAPWRYIDWKSYDNGGPFDGYHVLNKDPNFPHMAGTSETRIYENPNSFQLVCPGLDKDVGPVLIRGAVAVQWAEQLTPGFEGLVNFIDQGPGSSRATSDNICNFSDGRLSLITENSRDSSAVQ